MKRRLLILENLNSRIAKVSMFMAVLFMFNAGSAFAQGDEDFTNLPDGTSYSTKIWTGSDGLVQKWNATKARADQNINGRAITTNGSGTITSPTYADGMGTLQFNYVRAFTGTGDRFIDVYVNGQQQGSQIVVSKTSNTVAEYFATINITGDVVLELRTSGAQIKIDDISWTGYAGGLDATTFEDNVKSVTIRKNSTDLHITSPHDVIDKITVYDITGRLVFEKLNCNTNTFTTNTLVTDNQTLIVKVQLLNGGSVTKKVF